MPAKSKKLKASKKNVRPLRTPAAKKPLVKKKAQLKTAVKKPAKKGLTAAKSKPIKKPDVGKKNNKVASPPKKTLSKVITTKKATPQKNEVKKKPVTKPIKNTIKKTVKAPAQPVKPAARPVKAEVAPAKNIVTKKAVAPKPSAVVPSAKAVAASTATAKKATLSPLPVKKPGPTRVIPKSTKRPGAGPAGFLPYEAKTGEEYMNDTQLTHFQHVLHLWKQQLHADRDATTQHMRDDTINFPDPLDRAALEEEHTLEWRAREREHRLIIKIDQALASIKQGDYGYCEACGAEIGIRRLEARPTATQCIDCKTIDEMRERHTGIAE